MCMYFFAHAFVCDAFMFRLAPTIHCILTSYILDNIIDFGSTTSVTNVQSSTISNVTTVIQSSPSQSVNTTANESTNNNNSTTVAIIAAVAGSLLVLCIIGICILAIMVKKRRNRSNQKMKHLEFSASAVAM